jgi:hypothetical protein
MAVALGYPHICTSAPSLFDEQGGVMTEHVHLVNWHDSPIGPTRKVADLPRGGFATIENHTDTTYCARIRFDAGLRRTVLIDIFPDFAHAENWVEGKAMLLAAGKPVEANKLIEPIRVG